MDSIEQEQEQPAPQPAPLVAVPDDDDKEWREVNIHDDDENNSNDDDSDTVDDILFRNIFDTAATATTTTTTDKDNDGDPKYEDVEYDFPLIIHQQPTSENTKEETATSNRIPKLVIRHQGEYPYSTGLAVWGGSELLAKYLIMNSSIQHLLRREQGTCCNVMEIGAGTGLCGIVAYYLLLLCNRDMRRRRIVNKNFIIFSLDYRWRY